MMHNYKAVLFFLGGGGVRTSLQNHNVVQWMHAQLAGLEFGNLLL